MVFKVRMNLSLKNSSTASGTTYVYNEDYVYVKRLGSGDKAGASPDNAADTIQAGIAYAQANDKSRVVIAQGTYVIDIDDGPIAMVEGISIMGGFNPTTWKWEFDPSLTVIRAQATLSPNPTTPPPLCAITAGPEITGATSLTGLTVESPDVQNGSTATALLIDGGNPTMMAS